MQEKSSLTHGVEKNGTPPYKREREKELKKVVEERYESGKEMRFLNNSWIVNNEMTYEHETK